MDVSINGLPKKINIKGFDKIGDVNILMVKGEKGDTGYPTDAQVDSAVADWLDEHPEATTTVEDGAIALPKLAGDVKELLTSSAEQLISTNYTEDKVPYNFRKSGGDGSDRKYEEIVGGSIAFNQLVKNGNFADTSNWTKTRVTMTVSGNVASLSSSSDGDNYMEQSYQSIIPVGHKVLYSVDVSVDSIPSGASNVLALSFFYGYAGNRDRYYATDTNWHTVSKVLNIEQTAGSNPRFVALRVENPKASVTTKVRNAILIDLTQMFGSAVADYIYGLGQTNGVNFIKSLFPKAYYPYNTGELISVSGLTAHKTTGFNQWDEEWETGTINPNTGETAVDANYYRSKNFIPVVPSSTYFIKAPSDSGIRQFFYDADKNYISFAYAMNYTTTVPSNCAYMKIRMLGKTYNHDICINFSGGKDGQYEPYDGHTYPLDSSLTLRGVPKLVNNKVQHDGDIYQSDGTVQRRYGIVDLGTLTYSTSTGDNRFLTSSLSTLIKKDGSGVYGTINLMCPKFVPVEAYAEVISVANTVWVSTSGNISFNKGSYTDENAFKTAMNGVYLVYELATPTTEQADPYVNPQIVSEYGTEEFISTQEIPVPVGHNSKYPENLRKKLEGLPSDFSNLIAPTEITNKATRNYVVGSYLILNNTLYKVTQAIANGGTITSGTNVTATTIMAEIIALR